MTRRKSKRPSDPQRHQTSEDGFSERQQPKPKGRTGPRPVRDQPQRSASGTSAAADPALLFGQHAVLAAINNPAREITEIWCTDEIAEAAIEALAVRDKIKGRPQHIAFNQVRRPVIDALFPPSTVHQGLAARVKPLATVHLEALLERLERDQVTQAVVMVLDQVTDPQNVGAILRSCAAFGAIALIVPERHAPPITGTLAKTASGAVEVVPIVRVTNLVRALEALKEAGFWTTGLAEEGERWRTRTFPDGPLL